MSEFANKYGITDTSMKALIKDGWISCSVPTYEEVVIHYRTSRSMQKTANKFNIDKRTVFDIVHKWGC